MTSLFGYEPPVLYCTVFNYHSTVPQLLTFSTLKNALVKIFFEGTVLLMHLLLKVLLSLRTAKVLHTGVCKNNMKRKTQKEDALP